MAASSNGMRRFDFGTPAFFILHRGTPRRWTGLIGSIVAQCTTRRPVHTGGLTLARMTFSPGASGLAKGMTKKGVDDP
jgi:hypothetical protein